MTDDTILKIGETLNRKYVIERYLGGGAFGEVYRVQNTFLKKRFAIKVFKVALDVKGNESTVQDLLDEAVILAKFDHKNIVKVHDADSFIADDGKEHVFFVMDYVPGGDLDDYWKSYGARFVPTDIVIDIIKQICYGLNVLHSEKPPMIHRDIKPQNIMIGYDSNGDVVAKLTDFGLVKAVNPSTLYASAKGTLSFKAPEFLDKKDDTSTDIFALGVTFYMLLTDKLPYPIDNELEALTGAWLKKTPKPISYYNPLIDDQRLEDIVFKAISTDHDERYQTAQEFLDAIIEWEKSKDEPYTPDEEVSEPEKPVKPAEPKPPEDPQPVVKMGKIAVSVKEGDKGIKGAAVKISRLGSETSFKRTTGSAGGCNFKEVPYGEYDIETVADGYIRNLDTVTVDSEEISFEIVLEKKPNKEFPKNMRKFIYVSDALEYVFNTSDQLNPQKQNAAESDVPPEKLLKKAIKAVSIRIDYDKGVNYLEQAISKKPEYKEEFESKLELWKSFILIKNPNTIDEGINKLKQLCQDYPTIQNEYGFALDMLSSKDASKFETEGLKYINRYDLIKGSVLIELAMLMDENIKNKYQFKLKNWKKGIIN